MNYRVIDLETYYRKGVFHHFSEDCKCSSSMTARIDVTELVQHSKETGSKFYLNVLYLISRVLNSRDDYKMGYLWQTGQLICYDAIHPTQYIFHEDTETCTPVYEELGRDLETLKQMVPAEVEKAFYPPENIRRKDESIMPDFEAIYARMTRAGSKANCISYG